MSIGIQNAGAIAHQRRIGLKWPEFDLKFCLVVSLMLGDFLGASVAQDGKFP